MTPAVHPGFPKAAPRFLAELARNNRRDWFQPRREEFERDVRGPMTALVEAVNASLRGFAPAYVTPPSASLFRVHRDVRFSKDKSPYKTEVAAHFPHQGGRPEDAAGFYLAFHAGGLRLGGGTYAPGPEPLARLRRHVAARAADFRAVTSESALVRAMGPLDIAPLRGMPRGFSKEHPEAALLRLTRAFFMTSLPIGVATGPRLLDEIVTRFRLLVPFVRHVDRVFAAR